MFVFGAVESMEKAPVVTTAEVIHLTADHYYHPIRLRAVEVFDAQSAAIPSCPPPQGYHAFCDSEEQVYSRFDISRRPLLEGMNVVRAERELLVESMLSPRASADICVTPRRARQ